MTEEVSIKKILVPSLITTLVALLTAFGSSWIVIPPERMPAGAISTLIITPVIALPLSIFVWMKVRQNKALTKQLKVLLAKDDLTGLATRAHFFARLDASTHLTGTTLMIDIDHFKQVNDRYGHLSGDNAIKAVAKILKKNTRPQDIACRFGGEEFVVFLSDVTPVAAEAVAERIRAEVEVKGIHADDAQFRVTVSVGGAEKAGNMPVSQAIKDADEQLYVAKESGRNRISFVERNALFD